MCNVGKDGIRSPYSVTTLTAQTGGTVHRVSHRNTRIINLDHLFLPEPKDDVVLVRDTEGPNGTSWLSSSRLRSTLPRFSRNRGRSSFGFPATTSMVSLSLRPPPSLSSPYSQTQAIQAYHSPYSSNTGSLRSRAANAIEAVHQFARSSFEAQRDMSTNPAADPFGGFTHYGLMRPPLATIEDVHEAGAETAEPEIQNPVRAADPYTQHVLHAAPSFESTSTARMPGASTPTPKFSTMQGVETSIRTIFAAFDAFQMLNDPYVNEEYGVLKLPPRAVSTVLPNDDPRFVLWGLPAKFELPQREQSPSRLRSGSDPTGSSSRPESIESVGRRPLVLAATIERWIAQLSSERNAEDLQIFFLTYRAFISSMDLLHILISRFHWTLDPSSSTSLPHPHNSGDLNGVLATIRMRTFLLFEYWLGHFFSFDFISNPKLGIVLTTWLNALHRSPLLDSRADAQGLAKKLAKLIVRMKTRHWDEGFSRLPSHIRRNIIDGIIQPLPPPSLGCSVLLPLLFKGHDIFQHPSRINLEDVDLDFSIPPPDGWGENDAGSPLRLQAIPPHGLLSSTNVNDLNDLLTDDFEAHAHMRLHSSLGIRPTSPPLPPMHRHGKLSRVILGTVGKVFRIGRHRHSSGLPLKEDDLPEDDLQLDADGNLIKVTEDDRTSSSLASLDTHFKNPPSLFLTSEAPSTPSLTDVSGTLDSRSMRFEEGPSEDYRRGDSLGDPNPLQAAQPEGARKSEEASSSMSAPMSLHQHSPQSLRSSSVFLRNARSSITSWRSSMSSLGNLLPRRSVAQATYPYPPGLLNVVSIDDYESDGSDADPRSKLRPTRRRLPRRDDATFVRRSVYSTSSGVNSTLSEGASSAHDAEDRRIGQRSLKMWHLRPVQRNFVQKESGRGDPEDALRRLEGQVDAKMIEENHQKIDDWLNWVERREAGEATDTGSLDEFQSDSDEDEYGFPVDVIHDESTAADDSDTPPVPAGSQEPALDSGKSDDLTFPEPETSEERTSTHPNAADAATAGPRLVATQVPQVAPSSPHHSFILDFSAQEIAEQMTVVDHEMFEKIQFHHLLSLDWAKPDLLSKSWIEFIKERSRLEFEAGQYPERNIQKINDVAAVRVRAHSVTRFVSTEIAQSLLSERSSLFCKFVRVAWKLYLINNYSSLVAVLAGLLKSQTRSAMAEANCTLPIWESRVLADLMAFTSKADNFSYVRKKVESLAGMRNHPPSLPKHQETQILACIPLLSVYFNAMYDLLLLPNYIDPSALYKRIGPNDNLLHPELFDELPELPDGATLKPLINVQKQRFIAWLIKDFAEGQLLTRKYNYPRHSQLYIRIWQLGDKKPLRTS
ncbi:ras guanine nucleotide exchange factor domain-containing protein [Cantharellus anzutake]|uniref:ras guanine nucleotide exchange factor domain-containing protein n=1 Tax=Cantharellus anzutake TaxID=1750568 RepID=UPI001906313A|nr:ras guanine nucleotide exchange factor domain-containing protein [Cantharellus anzutake]KAF8340552.1 ras guanine nucleotide exchange factor domain-containing protein [Cantharellus anzutake]